MLVAVLIPISIAHGQALSTPPAKVWDRGLSRDPNYFPIAVWLQDPRNAAAYRKAGINLYVGLWNGPSEEQLKALAAAKMPVICSQSTRALQFKENPIIVGWMHGDEPDNAQELPGPKKGYGPPIPTERIISQYERIKSNDPSRPVMLNLGQGVAYDNYIGRGVRRNHPEDYAEYIKGSDIVSFDIYPVVNENKEVAGKLEFVPRGVERLRKLGNGERIVWNCIEASHIGEADRIATPSQIRSEIWMSIIHGSRGIIYFVHQFSPKFVEASLLSNPELLAGVTEINREVAELAAVINEPGIPEVKKSGEKQSGTVAYITRQHDKAKYVFATQMDGQSQKAMMETGDSGDTTFDVLGENRSVQAKSGIIEDEFKPYAVHLYRSR